MIRLVVPAVSARPGPPLSPVLGQHAVKVADFVAEFNRASAGWTPTLPVRVRLTKTGTTKFTVAVPGPTTHLVLRGARGGSGRLSRTALYDAVRTRVTPAGVTPRTARVVLGSLRSTRWVPE